MLAGSQAVLIGVSDYDSPEFPSIRAARNSLQAMRTLLADPALCGWPSAQVTVIENPASAADLTDQVADLAESTTGVLLLYYVGHGALSDRGERDAHIRSADFFDVERYPAMTFTSTAIKAREEGFILEGDLTIKDVTKSVAFNLEINGFGPDAYGGTRAGISATTQINRYDFNVDFNGPIPGVPGGMAVGENVIITLEIEGVLQA